MTIIADQTLVRPEGVYHPTHSALLTPFELKLIYGDDDHAKREYIGRHLSESDRGFTKQEDWTICAISYDIVRNMPNRVADFRRYNPISPDEHRKILREWVDREWFGLGKILKREPTDEEFNADFKAHANDHRHRIVLVLKYPDKYRRR